MHRNTCTTLVLNEAISIVLMPAMNHVSLSCVSTLHPHAIVVVVFDRNKQSTRCMHSIVCPINELSKQMDPTALHLFETIHHQGNGPIRCRFPCSSFVCTSQCAYGQWCDGTVVLIKHSNRQERERASECENTLDSIVASS